MKAKQCFYIDLALRYGVEEAIILQCLREWLQERKADDDYLYRDNRGWLKLSIKQFQAEMPYFSAFKIQNALQCLKSLKLIDICDVELKETLRKRRIMCYSLTIRGYEITEGVGDGCSD